MPLPTLLTADDFNLPANPPFPVVFSDPKTPGKEIKLTLRRLDRMEVTLVMEKANKREQEYVTGFGKPDEEGYVPPKLLQPVRGQAVRPSWEACYLGSAIDIAQTCPPEERYPFEEIVRLMKIPAICAQMETVLPKILMQGGEPESDSPLAEKKSAKSKRASSDSPSTSEQPTAPE